MDAPKDKDGLVRRVMVQPHQKPGQKSVPRPRERAIHDLVLLKAMTDQDIPYPDSTESASAPPNAKVLKFSVSSAEQETFRNNSEERLTNTKLCSIQRPKQLIEPFTKDDDMFLQASANALLNKIQTLKEKGTSCLNPHATPFKPLDMQAMEAKAGNALSHAGQTSNAACYTDQGTITTIAEVHLTPHNEVLDNKTPTHSSRSTNFNSKGSESTIGGQEEDFSSTTDQMPAGSFQQETRELATACWDPQEEEKDPLSSETRSCLLHRTGERTQKNRKVHWSSDAPHVHYIEPVGKQQPTPKMEDFMELHDSRRTWTTGRSRQYRNQLIDVVTTLHQLDAINNKTDPKCKDPRTFFKMPRWSVFQSSKPKPFVHNERTETPIPIRKPLAQRQAEYTQHRARIFGTKLQPGIQYANFFPP